MMIEKIPFGTAKSNVKDIKLIEGFQNKLSEVLLAHRQTMMPDQDDLEMCPFCENHNVACGYFHPLDQSPQQPIRNYTADNGAQSSPQTRVRLLEKIVESLTGQVVQVETTTDDAFQVDLGANLLIAYRDIQPEQYLLEMPLLTEIWNWGRFDEMPRIQSISFPALLFKTDTFEPEDLDSEAKQMITASIQQAFVEQGMALDLEWNAVELQDDAIIDLPENMVSGPNAVEFLDRRLPGRCAELAYLRLAPLEEALFLKLNSSPPQYPCSDLVKFQNRLQQTVSEIVRILKSNVG